MSNKLGIAAGVIGTVGGYIGGLAAFDFLGLANRQDPIMSGMLALFVVCPIGAVAGAVLCTKLVASLRRKGPTAEGAGDDGAAGDVGVAKNSAKALGIVVAVVLVAGGLYAWYAIATATPWLNPNASDPLLLFEVRLAKGATMPANASDIRFDLQTDLNTMFGTVRADKFRLDGERPVLAGEVELSFRTRNRELEMKIKGRMDRTYQIRLTDKAPHSSEFRPWEAHPDGSEIRYRAKWPGREQGAGE